MDIPKIISGDNVERVDVISESPSQKLPQSHDSDGRGEGEDEFQAQAMTVTSSDIELACEAQSVGADIAQRLHQEGAGFDAAQALGHMADAGHSLGAWAARYMLVKVCGRSKNTLAAKTRDIATFILWFVQHHRDMSRAAKSDAGAAGFGAASASDLAQAGDIRRWTEADTRYFLRHLEESGKRGATVNRALFTLKHFARYVHEQPGGIFSRHGFPVADVAARRVDEPDCRKLSDPQVRAMFAAAREEVARVDARAAAKKGRALQQRGRARPRRNLAMLGILYYTGLRVSEMLALTRKQYDGAALYDVTRKGGRQARKLILHPECARLIDYYIEQERDADVNNLLDTGGGDASGQGRFDASRPLFLSAGSGAAVDRYRVRDLLAELAEKASVLPSYVGGAFTVHPHQLRHTFGALYRAQSGSDTETAAALGHSGLQYVGRYVRQTDGERVSILQEALRGGEV